MKKLLFILMIIACPVLSWGQQDPEEEEIYFVPLSEVELTGNQFAYRIGETYVGEFEEDPLKFVENYFDVHGLLNAYGKDRPDGLAVNFRHSRGDLDVTFDKEGHLTGNFHKCQNVLVPMAVRKQLLQEYPGWTMVKNVHISKGRTDVVDKQFYRIKLKKGNATKRVLIQQNPFDSSAITSVD